VAGVAYIGYFGHLHESIVFVGKPDRSVFIGSTLRKVCSLKTFPGTCPSLADKYSTRAACRPFTQLNFVNQNCKPAWLLPDIWHWRVKTGMLNSNLENQVDQIKSQMLKNTLFLIK
jgi:hypothetical protein